MNILVLSACSKSKCHDPVVEQPAVDAHTRTGLLHEASEQTATAEALYTGREHEHVTAAVEQFRQFATVDWYIVSAGFGLVNYKTLLPAYEATFSNQSKADLVDRAKQLGIDSAGRTKDKLIEAIGAAKDIPDDILALDLATYDYVFVVLGREYLLAIQPALNQVPAKTTAVVFAAESNRDLIEECTWIRSSEEDREHLGVTYMELKGRQLLELAERTSTAEELSDELAQTVS
ncbi:hypothetical protein DMJ13_20055 [halophilic archaeon]|nr:hypothetical protein DMJ13_20055 [halophilic archaeon]